MALRHRPPRHPAAPARHPAAPARHRPERHRLGRHPAAAARHRPGRHPAAAAHHRPAPVATPGGSAGRPPGLRAQIGAVRLAVFRLVQSHIELAKAEFSEILEEVKRLAIGAGVAFALLIYIGMLVPVGTTLFFGEWLFGSLGWGVLHGTELAIAIGLTAAFGSMRLSTRTIAGWYLAGLVIGVLVALVFGLGLVHEAWHQLAQNAAPNLAPDTAPLVVAAVVTAVVIGVLAFLIALLRHSGIGMAFRLLFVGLIGGLLLGAFTAISFSPQVGAALGLAVGLAIWSIGMIAAVANGGIDFEGLKTRLYPQQTIDTTKETLEWVREQTQRGPKS